MNSAIIAVSAIVYILVLFAVAWTGDRRSRAAGGERARPWVYAFSLGVYCTSWTFFGSVGVAATEGLSFLAIYIGPIAVFLLAPALLERLTRLAKAERITSIADLLASRYGKNPAVAAIATLIAVLATIPYISLQLQAVSTSVSSMVARYGSPIAQPSVIADLPFLVAMALALFAILFGTRHADATEHQDGLVLAIAMESVVKLAAFLMVGAWVTFVLFEPGELFRRAMETPEIRAAFLSPPDGGAFAAVGLSALAIVLLPRQFHMMVVENRTRGEFRLARWVFPAYLVAINLFVLPIAAAGLLTLGPDVNPDFYVLDLPLSAGADALSIVAFLGGLSAATAMVIVASVALSVMISNDLVLPLVLRRGTSAGHDARRLILNLRRSAILVILVLGYAYQRNAEPTSLSSIGLLSFTAIAQLGPPLLLGLYWKRANARGALAGLLVGVAVWAYVLFLPSLAAGGMQGLELGVDPLLFGTLASLGLNVVATAFFSLTRPLHPIERIQAALFAAREGHPRSLPRRTRSGVTVGELKTTVARYVGAGRTERAIAAFAAGEGLSFADAEIADGELIAHCEQILASVIGSASSRLVLSLLFQKHAHGERSALRLLNDASQALQYNRDLLRIALEQVDQGLAIFDSDYRLTFWNRQFRELLRLPTAFGRVGVPFNEVFEELARTGSVDPKACELAFEALSRPPALRQLAFGDTERVLDLRTNPMPEGGFVVTVSDITSRVRRSRELRELNETLEAGVAMRTRELVAANDELARARRVAEAADQGKTRFLAAAGHDILQPLNAARLYASALEDRGGGAPDLIANIGSSLEAVEAIIGAVLDISRLDAGQAEAKLENLPIARVFAQVETDLKPLADERRVKLVFVRSSARTRSDGALLRRLLQNLVSNAVKYAPGGKVVVGVRRRASRLELVVADNGLGIPADKREAIYDEFVRLDEGSRTAPGLGLGLAIVQRIARILGHEIAVASDHGRGTRFTVRLPDAGQLSAALSERGEPRGSSPLSMEGAEILCIDNEPTIRGGMEALLAGWGCAVTAAASLPEALDRLAERGAQPALLLVDYHLDGGETGLAAIAALRARLDPALPAILVTADRSRELRQQAKEAGVQVLTKPVKPASLRAAMAHHRRTRGAAAAAAAAE